MPPAEIALDLRGEVERYLESSKPERAAASLRQLWKSHRDLSTAAFVCSRFERLRGRLPLVSHRLFILRSFTVEPLVPLLRAGAFCAGIDLTVQLGDFNAYAQEILDGGSSLYSFLPNSVILTVRIADIAPKLWAQFSDLHAPEIKGASERASAAFESFIRGFRERSSAALIVHNLEEPIWPGRGIFDAQCLNGQSETVREINRHLVRYANAQQNVYILDYNALQARNGRQRWADARKYAMARLPISGDNLIHQATEWLRFLAPLSGRTAKALVVDLDNTLWGGVIGEDGLTGIQVGADPVGASYQALQRALLDLTRRGILLAICSKNNLDDAIEALEKHPQMLLRPRHFAAMRINWNDKVEGLREIAVELNIGTDALAFLDDNPTEREQVSAFLPEVTIIDLPENPYEYAEAVRDSSVFERLSLSTEDRERAALYAVQREREKGKEQFQSKEDFFRFLNQRLEIVPLSPENLGRIAQLTQKTNQFNLTTRRYSEQQISEIGSRHGWQVLGFRVRDRFGDQGLVGVCVTRDDDKTCEIETLLMSCRVIGRTVEAAFLSALASAAIARGCNRLIGHFLPTKKNAPAKAFYSLQGFQLESGNGDGERWVFDLAQRQIPCPGWIEVTMVGGENN